MLGSTIIERIPIQLLLQWFAVIVLLLPILAMAQEVISKPGEYRGYSRMLYDEVVHNSQYIVMRDGTRLAVTIFRPAIDGKAVETPYPVIWEGATSRGMRNPDGTVMLMADLMGQYAQGKERVGLQSDLDIVKFGYVLATVERRGQGASMGYMRGYHSWIESLDAYDTTEWLAKQSWSDGNVGVYGCSNTGEAAMHVPAAMPPHLKAIFAGCYSWNKYDGFLRGGILANWGTGPQSNPISAGLKAIPVDEDKDESMLKEAIRQHESEINLLALWKNMPYRDSWSDLVKSRFWMEGSTSTYQVPIERTGVGIYSYAGWKDDFRREQFVAYSALHNPSKLLIGPWEHCQNQGFDLITERLRFFDYWLKGIDNGIMKESPIYYYTIGAPRGAKWRFTSQWPLPDEMPTKYYLEANGILSTTSPDNSDGKDDFLVNYDVTLPKTGTGFEQIWQSCVLDDKGITYTSSVLPTDIEFTGHPIVNLWISSTAEEGNFFVYLEDVTPDGSVSIVTDGRLKGSLRSLNTPPYKFLGLPYHRSFQEDARPFTPGQPTQLIFDCLPMSYVFKSGHRIRLTITGADPREKDRSQLSPPPRITIFRDSVHSSYISLPMIPNG